MMSISTVKIASNNNTVTIIKVLANPSHNRLYPNRMNIQTYIN